MQEKSERNPDTADRAAGQPGFDCVLGAWHAHADELRGFLARRLGDAATADDLLHETFMRAMRAGSGFCRLENPRAWLFRVARNALIDHTRRQRPEQRADDTLAQPESVEEPLDALDDCLRRNLDRLSAFDRDVIETCDLRGVTQADYAASRGLTLPAAKSRLLRARRKLRRMLVTRCRIRFDEAGTVCCHEPPEE